MNALQEDKVEIPFTEVTGDSKVEKVLTLSIDNSIAGRIDRALEGLNKKQTAELYDLVGKRIGLTLTHRELAEWNVATMQKALEMLP